MVAPVSGPFVQVTQTFDYTDVVWRWRQLRPYTLPLRFIRNVGAKVSGPSIYNSQQATTAGWPASLYSDLFNKAYDAFKDNTSNSASLGASLAEFGQSYGMIAARAVQLLKFGRALRKGRFGDAADALRTSVPKGVSKSKSVASNYLEFHFGWSPLIGDIYDAIDVIQKPVKPKLVFGQARTSKGHEVIQNFPPIANTYGYNWQWGKSAVRLGAKIAVSNPNLALANNLGLINPALVVWELVPFSFVADWFVNVSQVLGSATDFLGLTLQDKYQTWFQEGTLNVIYAGNTPPGSHESEFLRWCNVDRALGFDTPSLSLLPYKPPGLRRAASAISLLVLQLNRNRR